MKTQEEIKQARRDYSYNHWLKTKSRGGSSIGRKGFVPPPPKPKYAVRYGSSVQPLVGERILIGPYKSKKIVMARRIETVKELIEQGNAREFDVKWLALYEAGYFDDVPD